MLYLCVMVVPLSPLVAYSGGTLDLLGGGLDSLLGGGGADVGAAPAAPGVPPTATSSAGTHSLSFSIFCCILCYCLRAFPLGTELASYSLSVKYLLRNVLLC